VAQTTTNFIKKKSTVIFKKDTEKKEDIEKNKDKYE